MCPLGHSPTQGRRGTHVLSDILLAVDRGDLAALILLDLTAAFDTVDHDVLLQRLKVSFGIDDVALR